MTDPSLSTPIRFGLRDDRQQVELGTVFAPKFDGNGLITAIAVDVVTGEILMVAFMNEESLKLTLKLGEAVYYSRSRKEIWHKGATSGNTQAIVEILTDCDQDALILKVSQTGSGACHTGARTCFYRRVDLKLPLKEDETMKLQPATGSGMGE